MNFTQLGEIQSFLLIAATSAGFLYWINHKYKSLNRQIIRAIDIPVYLLNRQGIVVKLLNTPTEKANRLPFQNLGTLNINDLVTDADECRKHMASLLRVLDTRTSDNLTVKIRVESGEELYIAVRMVYLNRNYVMAFIRNITEDEVQRQENEKYRFFLESILENLPIATSVKDKIDEGRYLICNKKAAEMMDVPAKDIVGHYEEEFKPLMQDNFIQHLFCLRIFKMKILQILPYLASRVDIFPIVIIRVHDIHYIQIGVIDGRHVRHPTQEFHHFGICRLVSVFLTFSVIQDTDKDDHHQDNQTDKQNHFYRMFLPKRTYFVIEHRIFRQQRGVEP